jgi:hypothetical protein
MDSFSSILFSILLIRKTVVFHTLIRRLYFFKRNDLQIVPKKVQWHMDKKINVVFYQTSSGNEPVREWLKSLSIEDR